MPSAAIDNSLAPFQLVLMGTRWTNQALPGAPSDEGSVMNPLSYNTMPLPQATESTDGYILKNCTVTEILQFDGDDSTTFPTTAPNRASDALQLPTALYYQQRVFFGDGPSGSTDPSMRTVVHTENGSWLNIATGPPLVGAYDSPVVTGSSNQIAKQMSVPHGNSILASGSYDDAIAGTPAISDANTLEVLPSGVDTSPFTTLSQTNNPKPEWAVNPNIPIQMAVQILQPTNYIHWSVTTKNGSGATANIAFEQRNADVTDYVANYWLMAKDDDAKGAPAYAYLAYSQNILFTLNLGGTAVPFSHWTTNVLTLVR